jgi:uncharacterized membrane protein
VFAERPTAFVHIGQELIKTATAHTSASADPALLGLTLAALVDGLVFDRLIHPHTALPGQNLPEAITQLVMGFGNHFNHS